jgi:hypothetical protein
MTMNMNTASELYLGRDRQTALSLGARRFRTAAGAIRFTMEQAAPVSRRGALLQVGDQHLDSAAIAQAYDTLDAGEAMPRPNRHLLDSSEIDSP